MEKSLQILAVLANLLLFVASGTGKHTEITINNTAVAASGAAVSEDGGNSTAVAGAAAGVSSSITIEISKHKTKKCAINERFVMCPEKICEPQVCSHVGYPQCSSHEKKYDHEEEDKLSPEAGTKGEPCSGPPACVCKVNYVRNHGGVCMPVEECPSCGGDKNATHGCGVNCGRRCSNYDKGQAVCTDKCYDNSCDCKEGYVFDDYTGHCVKPEDCSLKKPAEPEGTTGSPGNGEDNKDPCKDCKEENCDPQDAKSSDGGKKTCPNQENDTPTSTKKSESSEEPSSKTTRDPEAETTTQRTGSSEQPDSSTDGSEKPTEESGSEATEAEENEHEMTTKKSSETTHKHKKTKKPKSTTKSEEEPTSEASEGTEKPGSEETEAEENEHEVTTKKSPETTHKHKKTKKPKSTTKSEEEHTSEASEGTEEPGSKATEAENNEHEMTTKKSPETTHKHKKTKKPKRTTKSEEEPTSEASEGTEKPGSEATEAEENEHEVTTKKSPETTHKHKKTKKPKSTTKSEEENTSEASAGTEEPGSEATEAGENEHEMTTKKSPETTHKHKKTKKPKRTTKSEEEPTSEASEGTEEPGSEATEAEENEHEMTTKKSPDTTHKHKKTKKPKSTTKSEEEHTSEASEGTEEPGSEATEAEENEHEMTTKKSPETTHKHKKTKKPKSTTKSEEEHTSEASEGTEEPGSEATEAEENEHEVTTKKSPETTHKHKKTKKPKKTTKSEEEPTSEASEGTEAPGSEATETEGNEHEITTKKSPETTHKHKKTKKPKSTTKSEENEHTSKGTEESETTTEESSDSTTTDGSENTKTESSMATTTTKGKKDCKGRHEFYYTCAPKCPQKTCADYLNGVKCKSHKHHKCKPECRCLAAYYKSDDGRCLSKKECKREARSTTEEMSSTTTDSENQEMTTTPSTTMMTTTPNPNCVDVAYESFLIGNLVYTTKVLLEVALNDPGNNALVGGASILFMLGQPVVEAEEGILKKEILKVLHLKNIEQVLCLLPEISANLTTKYQDIEYDLFCKIYADKSHALTSEFITSTTQIFGIGPENVDFNSLRAVKKINTDVEKFTNKHFLEFIEPPTLASLNGLVLVDAERFQGKWEKQFNPLETSLKDFYTQGRIDKIKFMHQRGNFLCADSSKLSAKILQLKYQGGIFDLTIFLPYTVDGIKEVAEKLQNAEDTLAALNSLELKNVDLYLPIFSISVANILKSPSKLANLKEIFNNETTGLKDIGSAEPPYVSEILQKITYEVNEFGMGNKLDIHFRPEKAVNTKSLPKITFKADHAFYFMLTYKTRLPLFAGIFMHI